MRVCQQKNRKGMELSMRRQIRQYFLLIMWPLRAIIDLLKCWWVLVMVNFSSDIYLANLFPEALGFCVCLLGEALQKFICLSNGGAIFLFAFLWGKKKSTLIAVVLSLIGAFPNLFYQCTWYPQNNVGLSIITILTSRSHDFTSKLTKVRSELQIALLIP